MKRSKGSVEKLPSGALRVSVYAGWDAVTHRRLYLREVVPAGPRAEREADKARTRLLAQVDAQQFASTTATVNELLDRYLATAEVTDDVRQNNARYANKHIRPFIGDRRIGAVNAEVLESLYAELRRCREHCRKDANHDCRPLAPWTVRKVHYIIHGAYQSAIRWKWTTTNPAVGAVKPAPPPVNPRPPSAAEASRILTAAYQVDDDWGAHIWLAMTTGARRGELCAVQWSDVDLDRGVLELTATKSGGHRRRIALDPTSIEILTEARQRYEARVDALGTAPNASAYLFSDRPDHCTPVRPQSVSQRYKRMTTKLGIETHLHNLRHYSATELIASGVDVRTVAGRLGHADATTTLKVYAAWLAESDQRAATSLHKRMPDRPVEHRKPPGTPYQHVANQLRKAILIGEYSAAAPLPPIVEIAADFDVSVGTAHRAIAALKGAGLVEARRGVRAQVRPENEWPDDTRAEATRLRDASPVTDQVQPEIAIYDNHEDLDHLLDLSLVRDGVNLRTFSAVADPNDSVALRKLLVNAVRRVCPADADLSRFDLEVRQAGSTDLLRVFVAFQ